ncbi:MAG: HD domain-containing protein [Desulfobulbaceae bacterium]|nr:MAG: HD domain-containing protein [Desulfobulbaceae bacterium]
MPDPTDNTGLFSRLRDLNRDEERRLSPAATLSRQAIRRNHEERGGYRQQFALDADRILHSRAYTRYIDKTQVFSLFANDHITHRVLHVQLVARIARTIGRFLGLNEDLIEAIALGHDIGHPPFGHGGEAFLSRLCREHGLPPFQHNVQSVRFLDRLERKGRGWNLSLQTLDGILCHDGEVDSGSLTPDPIGSFADFDRRLQDKSATPDLPLIPATAEGCVVRLADTIAYIGRDIEDAIVLGLISRADIPGPCRERLGDTNGTIVYTLTTDLIAASTVPAPGSSPAGEMPVIGFSAEIARALAELKTFNYQRIYLAPETRKDLPVIGECYAALFSAYLGMLASGCPLPGQIDLMTDMDPGYRQSQPPAAMVRDYIAGMTDDFFLAQAAAIGCRTPVKR